MDWRRRAWGTYPYRIEIGPAEEEDVFGDDPAGWVVVEFDCPGCGHEGIYAGVLSEAEAEEAKVTPLFCDDCQEVLARRRR